MSETAGLAVTVVVTEIGVLFRAVVVRKLQQGGLVENPLGAFA